MPATREVKKKHLAYQEQMCLVRRTGKSDEKVPHG
jgi:hypothetical protein